MQAAYLALGAGVLVALIAARGGSGPPAAPRTSDKRSRLITTSRRSDLTEFNLVDGEVVQSPEQVAQTINRRLGEQYPLSVIALATMISSEAGGASNAVRGAIGWTAKNRSLKTGQSIYQIIAPSGRFGVQGTAKREFSTSRPPSKRDLGIASQISIDQIKDTTRGSTSFDHPSAQRKYMAQQAEGYKNTPELVAENRRKSGMSMVTLPGVSPEYIRFWNRTA